MPGISYLKLNLGLSNVLLASVTVRNLGGLGNLCLDSLGAEVLKREALDGIDAEDRVGLDDGESSRNWIIGS